MLSHPRVRAFEYDLAVQGQEVAVELEGVEVEVEISTSGALVGQVIGYRACKLLQGQVHHVVMAHRSCKSSQVPHLVQHWGYVEYRWYLEEQNLEEHFQEEEYQRMT